MTSRMSDLLASRPATDAVLAGEMRYARRGQRVHPFWWAAMQMFIHGTHHRGQATTLLFQAGKDHRHGSAERGDSDHGVRFADSFRARRGWRARHPE